MQFRLPALSSGRTADERSNLKMLIKWKLLILEQRFKKVFFQFSSKEYYLRLFLRVTCNIKKNLVNITKKLTNIAKFFYKFLKMKI